jgi:hypothetical protein
MELVQTTREQEKLFLRYACPAGACQHELLMVRAERPCGQGDAAARPG